MSSLSSPLVWSGRKRDLPFERATTYTSEQCLAWTWCGTASAICCWELLLLSCLFIGVCEDGHGNGFAKVRNSFHFTSGPSPRRVYDGGSVPRLRAKLTLGEVDFIP